LGKKVQGKNPLEEQREGCPVYEKIALCNKRKKKREAQKEKGRLRFFI